MAEFSELVRTKKRVCAKYKKDNCFGCPISGILCGIISISSYSDLEFKEFEDALMAWAAEHPAPKYPTWMEYLFTIYDTVWPQIATMEIPDDIAEKLGIEPKEETF